MKHAVDANAYMDLQGLAALKGKVSQSGGRSIDEVRQVASHFESMFVQMLMKNMRATSFDEGGVFDSDYTKFYQKMFDQQISVEVSKGKGLGIADMLVRQLSGQAHMNAAVARPSEYHGTAASPTPAPSANQKPSSPEAAPAAPADTTPAKPTEAVDARWQPDSPASFLQSIWPHARAAARELGVPAEAVMAQAALETGWGQHVMQRGDGRSSFNLFGIKAGDHWEGERVTRPTLEFRDGVMEPTRAAFRAYESLAEGFNDYVRLLSKPRYSAAVAATDSQGFAAGLQRAGYATDPDYAKKINSIINRPEFQQQLAALKQAAPRPLASAEDPVPSSRGTTLTSPHPLHTGEG